MTVGETLKTERRKKNLTQKELANKIGKSERMIQKYENGEVMPSINVLGDISIALGVTINDLIIGDENVEKLAINQAAYTASKLFPYNGDENDWIMKNLNPEQKEDYIRNSKEYLEKKQSIAIRDKQLDLLAKYIETIACDFIELPKDNIDVFSRAIAFMLIDNFENITKTKISEIINNNMTNLKK